MFLAQNAVFQRSAEPFWLNAKETAFYGKRTGYGRSEFDRLMPGAGLSYTITSRELVLQAPHPTAGAAGPLRALPLTPRLKGMIL